MMIKLFNTFNVFFFFFILFIYLFIYSESYPISSLKHDSAVQITSHFRKGDWTEQFPISSGSLGVFVGGTRNFERIPISISEFYTFNRAKLEEEERQDSSRPVLQRFDFTQKASMLQYLSTSKSVMKSHIRNSLGSFQYLYDLTLVFDHLELGEQYKSSRVISKTNLSRSEMILKFGRGRLDLLSGISQQYFFDANENSSNLRYEKWFGNWNKDLIYGQIKCVNLTHYKFSTNCINVSR